MKTQTKSLTYEVQNMALLKALKNTDDISETIERALRKKRFPNRHQLELQEGWRHRFVYAMQKIPSNPGFHLVNRDYETFCEDKGPNGKLVPQYLSSIGFLVNYPRGVGVKEDYDGIWLYDSIHRPWDSRKDAEDYLQRWMVLEDFLDKSLFSEEWDPNLNRRFQEELDEGDYPEMDGKANM